MAEASPTPSPPAPATNLPLEHDPIRNAAREAAAAQLRRLHHELVGREHDLDELAEITADLDALGDRLEKGSPRHRPPWKRRDASMVPAEGEAFTLDFDRPVSGPGNPWSVPTPIIRRGDRAETTVVLGPGYEGAPQRAHGGIVAAIYDDLAGFNLVLETVNAFTGWIRIDYRAATPINESITFSTWVDRIEGRKVTIRGECRWNDEVITTCEALFITIDIPDAPTP